MRTTAVVVVLTFSGLITAPAVAAIRTAPETPPGQTLSAERQLSNTVRHIRARLGHLADKLSKAKPHANERAELAQLNAGLDKLTRKVRKGFERTGLHRRRAFRSHCAAMIPKLWPSSTSSALTSLQNSSMRLRARKMRTPSSTRLRP